MAAIAPIVMRRSGRAGLAASCSSPATISTPVKATSAIGSAYPSDVQVGATPRSTELVSTSMRPSAASPRSGERQLREHVDERERSHEIGARELRHEPAERRARAITPTPISSAERPLIWPMWPIAASA